MGISVKSVPSRVGPGSTLREANIAAKLRSIPARALAKEAVVHLRWDLGRHGAFLCRWEFGGVCLTAHAVLVEQRSGSEDPSSGLLQAQGKISQGALAVTALKPFAVGGAALGQCEASRFRPVLRSVEVRQVGDRLRVESPTAAPTTPGAVARRRGPELNHPPIAEWCAGERP
jgi:hypothetical protein